MSEIVIRFGTGGTEKNVIDAINKIKASKGKRKFLRKVA